VQVSATTAYPSIEVILTTPSGKQQQYVFALVEIIEQDVNGDIVRSIDTASLVFTSIYAYDSTIQSWSFNNTVSGYGQIYVYFTYATTPSLRRSEVAQTPNTLSMAVNLNSWAFKSAQNTLQLVLQNSIVNDNFDECNIETSVFAGSLDWFLLYSNSVALFYEMPQTALLDDYTRYLTNAILSTTGANTISNVPFFWYNMSLATSFGFIVDDDYTGCGPAAANKAGIPWEVYLSIPGFIILLVIVLIIIMFILRPARCFRRRRPVSTYDTKMTTATSSEMVILPPASPPSELPPPPQAWQGDPHASMSHLPVDPRMSAYHPAAHMSMQFPPPPNQTYRPAHASAPYPQYNHDSHQPHPSAPVPSPDNSRHYMPAEH
jgi:hypothetical protein